MQLSHSESIKADLCQFNDEVFICLRIVQIYYNIQDVISVIDIGHKLKNLSDLQIWIKIDLTTILRGQNKMLGKRFYMILPMKRIGDA